MAITILGVDPGSRLTGFGIIQAGEIGQRDHYVASGCIRTKTETLPSRLQEIYQGITEIVARYQPTVLAIEQVFVARNATSALKLGQARGVIMVACVQRGLAVFEYAPNRIKQAVVGAGHASKAQVQYMIRVLLGLSETPPPDAADALAIALCHAHSSRF